MMTTEDISILPGMDFISYCNRNGLSPETEVMKIDSENIQKMWIVDYLISNGDRHGMNWGFFYNSKTNEILKCHPLYDHNNAFDKTIMENKDAPYVYFSSRQNPMSIRKAAHFAMKHVDFHFLREITRNDFLSQSQYDSFHERAKELNIPIKKDIIYPSQKDIDSLSKSFLDDAVDTSKANIDNMVKISKHDSLVDEINCIIDNRL